jgi:hypothetical protein
MGCLHHSSIVLKKTCYFCPIFPLPNPYKQSRYSIGFLERHQTHVLCNFQPQIAQTGKTIIKI